MAQIAFEFDQQQMLSQIADNAAYRLVENLRHELEREIRCRVTKAIDDQLNGIVVAVLEKQFQPTDSFGDAVGEPTTIKTIIATKAKAFMDEKVDSSGRGVDRNAYNSVGTRAQWLLGKMAGEAINRAAEQEIKGIAAEAKASAHAKVAKLLVETLAKS